MLWYCVDIGLGNGLLPDSTKLIQQNANNKSSVIRQNTLSHLDQYMAQHGRIVKQLYCKTV